MALVTFDNIQIKQEGGFSEVVGIIDSATAADTVDISGFLNGKSVCSIEGFNVTDEVAVDHTISSSVVTIGTGPSTDKVSVVFKLID